MRVAAVSVLTLLVASVAMAQVTPGVVVRSGQPFPIVADFNGDGLDDLIQERNVILNNGTLEVQHDLGLPDGERVVAVLDINGDHKLELITMTSQLMLPPSLGEGTHAEPGYRLYISDSQYNYGSGIDIASGPPPLVADVDADGKDDIILVRDVFEGPRAVAADVTILRSRGDGTFDRLPAIRTAPDPQIYPDFRVPIADMNRDGIPDLVFRCPQDLVVLLGLGGGKFAVEDHYLPQEPDYGTQSMRLADVDGDGNVDVILPGFRAVRVLFGDGRGNFARSTIARAARQHDIIGFPAGVPVDLDHVNQPRDLAVGNFTQGDRVQIAGAMSEGDIVIFAWDRGSLNEVARTRTEFWLPTIRSGNFRSGGGTDLYAMGTAIWGDMYPRPRVFNGGESVTIAGAAPVRQPSRRRALRPAVAQLSMQVQISGDCIDARAERWLFEREGIFGLAETSNEKVEVLFDAPLLYFRLSAPFAQGPVFGVLTESNGTYSGTAGVMTACGWKTMSITSTMN
jgi:VCBS repeat protein